ncbi:hypothetical protein PV797_00935 [Clostridiaceae bacterium M8S5]|nr:hypothetical protein PV797_00935 [Clostridiaceae bacterium M8S5]
MNKKIKSLPEEAKIIKVIGQRDCLHDCKQTREISGRNYPINGGMVPVCYVRRCTVKTYYDAFLSKKR